VARGFVVPALPVVSTLGIVTCGAMIYGLGWTNWLRLGCGCDRAGDLLRVRPVAQPVADAALTPMTKRI
jgi:hypothetical protein